MNGKAADRGLDHKGLIKISNFTFSAKFFWLLVRHPLFPTAVDNILTWDRAVLVAALVAGLDIDVAKLLICLIHERAFKSCTT